MRGWLGLFILGALMLGGLWLTAHAGLSVLFIFAHFFFGN